MKEGGNRSAGVSQAARIRDGAGADPIDAEAAAARRAQTATHYRLAAVLFLGGGLGAIVPDALHRPAHPPEIYLLPLLAVVSGLIVLALAPRLPRSGLHVVAIVATLEIALTVALADTVFAVYYTFVAIFVAYVFTSRASIAFHIAFTSLAAFAPAIYDSESARQGLIEGMILAPTLILAGGTVAYLRERVAESEERYRRLSELDPLTGVGNYRTLGTRVPRELRRHARFAEPLAVLVIDLDDFKRVNDSFGHQRGDAILQEVAGVLEDGVREHDIVVRQGGDEFAVVALETDEQAANELAERLEAAVGRIAADATPIGASVGCAHFPGDAETLEGLLEVADARLGVAKSKKPARLRRTGVRIPPPEQGRVAAAG